MGDTTLIPGGVRILYHLHFKDLSTNGGEQNGGPFATNPRYILHRSNDKSVRDSEGSGKNEVWDSEVRLHIFVLGLRLYRGQ